jgi:hypothetical protein
MEGRRSRPGNTSSTDASATPAVQRTPGKTSLVDQAYGRPADSAAVADTAAAGVQGGGTPLPFLSDLKESFGRHGDALDGATAHVGGAAGDAATAIGAEAYATGDRVAFREQPDRALVGHEAAHVVQQRAGVQLKGGVGVAGDPYEQNADAVGEAFAAGGSAEALLDGVAGGGASPTTAVQRKPPAGNQPQGPAAGAGGNAAAPSVGWDDALNAMAAITDLLEADGMPIFTDNGDGTGSVSNMPASAKKVGPTYQPLLDEWWKIIVGKWKVGAATVSYTGDVLTTHIDAAIASTAPLVAELKAEGDATTGPWLATNYEARVLRLRQRAASEAVSQAVDTNIAKGQGGDLDFNAMSEIDQLTAASTEAIKTLRAVMTVSTRFASANLNQARDADAAFAKALGVEKLPPELSGAKGATSINTGLGLAQGLVYAVQSVITISDPKKRYEHYKEQWSKFGKVAGTTEFLKDLGVAIGGVTAVAGVGAFALAQVSGKADLAAKALAWGGRASTELGKVNIALNALGVIHGIAVLCDSNATAMEKTEAGVEVASGALGLAGRFLPAISPITASLSASLLINFYAFKGILQQGLEGYAGLIALGFNICYESMKKDGGYMSNQALHYASALDLAGTMNDDPLKAAELVKQTEAQRWNLVETEIKPFIQRATTSAGGGNADPGVYSVLRPRFQALGPPTVDTPDQTIAYTSRLLGVIVGCFTNAQDLYKQQVYASWKEGA